MQKVGSTLLAAAVLMLGLGLAAQTKATPLFVSHPLIPQLEGLFINITYSSVTDTLTATDTIFSAFALDDGTTLHTIIGGGLNLSAPIDNLGVLTSTGSINVTGTIAALNFNSGTLLTGTLTAFGFPDNVTPPPAKPGA